MDLLMKSCKVLFGMEMDMLACIYIEMLLKILISLKTNMFVEYSPGAGGVREVWSEYMRYIS
jgi:hypothetical protein